MPPLGPPSFLSEGPRATILPEDEASPDPELGESPQLLTEGPTEETEEEVRYERTLKKEKKE